MDFQYVGYTEDRKIVKGTLVAASSEIAAQTITQQGYNIISLKPVATFMPSWERIFPSMFRIKPETIIIFSRQLALLLESGIDIVTSLELLLAQSSNHHFKMVLAEIVSDLRSGNRLSAALNKHPEVFPSIYRRSLSVAEQTGSLETVIRQVADYMEKEATTRKKVKGALMYPVLVSVVAVVVIAALVVFVIPAFASLYSSLGAGLPLLTRILLAAVNGLSVYGPYLLVLLFIAVCLALIYVKTPQGRYQWDRLALRLPLVGRVNHLNELARCCRSMSLLFRAGLPLSELMTLIIEGSGNRVMVEALTDVQQNMLKGEGLSQPMAKSKLFLPMMVQMARVGEETGNLDATMLSVAESYEIEAEDRTSSLIALIQPAMTLTIGLIVAFIAMSLVSAMYSVYGQVL
jgi:type IV pilus assembly protein PilC